MTKRTISFKKKNYIINLTDNIPLNDQNINELNKSLDLFVIKFLKINKKKYDKLNDITIFEDMRNELLLRSWEIILNPVKYDKIE